MYNRLLIGMFCSLALIVGSAGVAGAAEFTVEVRSNVFIPQNLTIQAGDTVTWVNMGGFHNVEANDGSFRCANGCDDTGGNGDPSGAAWTASRTFNTPGTTNYVCIVHAPGMAGTITVQAGAPDEPGNLRFAQSNVNMNEGIGNATVSVNRVNGDDGAVSVMYSTSNGSAQAGSDYTASSGTLNWADNDDNPKIFTVPIIDDGLDENSETINISLSSPTGGAGLGSPSSATITILDNDDAAPTPGTLAFVSNTFQANEDAGTVQINVSRTGGNDGPVSVDFTTADGSAEAGDDYTATSGTLDWADGDSAVKSFTIPIIDDAEEEASETVNLTLSNPGGGADLGTSSATFTINDNDQVAEACTPGPQTLCLQENGRFKVEVEFADFQGNTGVGQTVDINKRDSGLIFFFSEYNIEMLIKILNACNSEFNAYWVFYAATTNVEFTVTVTDTATNTVQVYSNELGVAAEPILDTAAFLTCP